MPELAELKLTADYVNQSTQGRVFGGIEKNPIHKGAEVSVPFDQFEIQAKSRGKELLQSLKTLIQTESIQYGWVWACQGTSG